MKQQVTINEFVVMFIDEMRRIGYSEEGIYRDHYRIIRRIARYYELSKHLVLFGRDDNRISEPGKRTGGPW